MIQTFTDFEIIFVDNNSVDGSLGFVKDNYSDERIRTFQTEFNLGFSGGNNFGCRYCSGEYIVLLNNDTAADKNWLKNLIECIEANDNAGIVQSLVLTDGIPVKYYEMNGTINLLGHNIMEVFDIGTDGTGEIFQANGCSLIIRKKLADELGGLFPDEYFAYAEDTYLSFKVKFRGLRILHTSESVVYHKGGGASQNSKSSFLYFYQERNRLLNFLIFFSNKFTLKYIPYLIFNFFMKLVMSLFSEKYSSYFLIKAYWWILTNKRKINQYRKDINKTKYESEDYVLGFLSGKIFNGSNVFEKTINYFSLLYCRLVNIPVVEIKKNK